MKGSRLITWLITAVLIAGSVSPVYGADILSAKESAVGAAQDTDEDIAYEGEDFFTDESVSDIPESADAAVSTDAVPGSVGDAVTDESESGVVTDESTAELTDSRTDSLEDSGPGEKKNETEMAVGAKYTSAVPEDGKTYYIRCAVDKNITLTVSGNSVDNKANVLVKTLTKTLDQKFICRKMSDGTFAFMNLHSGKALRIEGNKAKNSANLWQQEFNNASSGRWKPIKNSDGSYRIASGMNTKYVLDVYAGVIADNSNAQVYSSNNTKAQKFIFTETPVPDYSATIQLRPSYVSEKCGGPAKNADKDGEPATLKSVENNTALTYEAIRYSTGYYILSNVSSGLVLSVKNGEKKAGAAIIHEKRNNKFCQQWLMRKNSNGTYTFLSRLDSTLCMAVEGGSKTNGAKFILSTYKNYSSQKYYTTIYSGTTVPAGEVYIRSVLNSDRVVDAAAAGTADGTRIDCYDWNATKAQRYKLIPIVYEGKDNYWFKIENVNSGKVLEVEGNTTAGNPRIVLGTYKTKKGQLWRPTMKDDGGYLLRSALNQNMVIGYDGSEAYGSDIHLMTCENNARQKWYFTPCRITGTSIDESDKNTVTVTASGTKVYSDTGKVYLFAINPYGRTVKGYTPVATASVNTSYTFHAKLNKDSASSLLHRKFYIATVNHGIYTVISNGFFIQNPEACASNTKAFPRAKRGTKKALKTGIDSQNLAKQLNCSHVVMDLPIETFLDRADMAYKYEGKTYHFSSSINIYRDRIKSYNDAGIVVTAIFYLADGRKTNLMAPKAVTGSRRGSAILYALNTKNGDRKTLEALFACLADKFCDGGCTVANWIYGNELQQYITYHYSGDIAYSEYHENLAEEFRLFNASIKSRWKNARTYISLDHNWNLASPPGGSYNGMELTRDFNTDLARQGLVHWDMAMHPYPSPEQDCRIWNRAYTITDSGDAGQFTMMNARSFSQYIKNTYGSSTHIIMSETGISSVYNGMNLTGEQAASVAFNYYLAEFDPNIDLICIHRDYDNSGEMAGGWHLGIYYSNGSPKPSADVFKYMDTKNWNAHVTHYMNTYIGSGWKSKIHGFDANFFSSK